MSEVPGFRRVTLLQLHQLMDAEIKRSGKKAATRTTSRGLEWLLGGEVYGLRIGAGEDGPRFYVREDAR